MILLKACMNFTEKKQDYKSDIFKITGFALMTPIGRIFIEPAVVFNEFGFHEFLIYLMVCFILTLVGLIFMYLGYVTIDR